MKERYTEEEIHQMGEDEIYPLVKEEMRIPKVAMMSLRELRDEAAEWLSERGRLIKGAASEGIGQTAPSAPPAPKPVVVRYGAYDGELPVAGKTVAQVLDQLRSAWNIDPNALVYLDGQTVVDLGTQIPEGVTLEFAKPAGVKG